MVPNSKAGEQSGLNEWISKYVNKLTKLDLKHWEICVIVVASTSVIGQVSVIFSFLLILVIFKLAFRLPDERSF